MAAGDVVTDITSLNTEGGAKFDGISNNIDTNFLFPLDFDKEWTISTRFKIPTSSNTGIIWSTNGAGGINGIQLRISIASRIVLFHATAGGTAYSSSNNAYSPDKWQQIEIVYDKIEFKIYINKVFYATAPLVRNWNSTNNINLGSNWDASTPLAGIISQVKIWNKALNITELTAFYQNELERTALIGEYILYPDYEDTSGKGNNATNTGSIIGLFDDNLEAEIEAARTTANDIYMLTETASKQIISTVIEEAP